MMDSLVQIDRARQALAQIDTPRRAKEVGDMAETLRAYLKRAGASLELQNEAAEVKLWAERAGGQLLAKMEKHKGGPVRLHDATTLKLDDLGIEKTQSHRLQLQAEIPEDRFREHIAETKDAAKELTSRGAIMLGLRLPKERHKPPKADTPPFDGLYDCVVIDPPWPMEKTLREDYLNQHAMDYPTMTLDEIRANRPPMAMAAHALLWTTHRFLPDALDVLKAWDVKYVCTFVWHKPGGFQPVGLPQYNCEFCLYGRHGHPEFTTTQGLKTCFEAARGKHSEKPVFFYESLANATDGCRLDMFNRRKIEGFDGWGA